MPLDETKPTVFVVDDDRQLRDSINALLDAVGLQVHCFGTPAAFRHFYHREMSGCLLLDIRMPGQDGLELYEQLLSQGARLPVIFITAHADVSTAVAAMKTGAIEFLEKPFVPKTLVELVQKALALDAQWRQRENEFAALEQRIGRLSERDQETLDLILAGESNKTMAAKLFLTERAVEMRRATIMRKLQVRSLPELLDLTVSHRILSEVRATTQQKLAR
jgi:FixJ family two-component response regulator